MYRSCNTLPVARGDRMTPEQVERIVLEVLAKTLVMRTEYYRTSDGDERSEEVFDIEATERRIRQRLAVLSE